MLLEELDHIYFIAINTSTTFAAKFKTNAKTTRKMKFATTLTALFMCFTLSASVTDKSVMIRLQELLSTPGPRSTTPVVTAMYGDSGIEIHVSSYAGFVVATLTDSDGNTVASETTYVNSLQSFYISGTSNLEEGTYTLTVEVGSWVFQGYLEVDGR